MPIESIKLETKRKKEKENTWLRRKGVRRDRDSEIWESWEREKKAALNEAKEGFLQREREKERDG